MFFPCPHNHPGPFNKQLVLVFGIWSPTPNVGLAPSQVHQRRRQTPRPTVREAQWMGHWFYCIWGRGGLGPLGQEAGPRIAAQTMGIWGEPCGCPLVSPVQPLAAAGTVPFLQRSRPAVAPIGMARLLLGPGRSILYSRSMWFCGGSPTQALGTRTRGLSLKPQLGLVQPSTLPPVHTPEDVLDAAALAEECVHHWAARRHERRLEQEAEQGQHRVEVLWLGVDVCVEADALAQLSEQHEVQHDGCRQQRVLERGGSGAQSHPRHSPTHDPTPRRTSHVLCSTSVLVPPSISSEVYSSRARLLSPT